MFTYVHIKGKKTWDKLTQTMMGSSVLWCSFTGFPPFPSVFPSIFRTSVSGAGAAGAAAPPAAAADLGGAERAGGRGAVEGGYEARGLSLVKLLDFPVLKRFDVEWNRLI
jgi:hypothetical protein